MYKRLNKRRRNSDNEVDSATEQDLQKLWEESDQSDSEDSSDGAEENNSAESDSEVLDEESDASDSNSEPDDEEEEEQEEEEEESDPILQSMTVADALSNPIFPVETGNSTCALCPNHVFKREEMIKLHVNSKAHGRRLARFKSLVKGVSERDLALEYLLKLSDNTTPVMSTEGLSKRQQKKAQKKLINDKKREKNKTLKAKHQAKKGVIAPPTPVETATPPAKKQKTDSTEKRVKDKRRGPDGKRLVGRVKPSDAKEKKT